jgi:radical SAM superfamily enzyme YgiQ (UPF0313 family)
MSIIAGALRKHGHEVEIADWLRSEKSVDVILQTVRRHEPRLIGMSIRNLDNANSVNEEGYVDGVRDLIRNIRTQSEATILLGGSGFSLMPEQFLKAVGADYGIVGEGESLVVDFVRDLERGTLSGEKCIRSERYLSGEQILGADYDSGLLEFYVGSGSVVPVQTKRGCNEVCVYCTYPVLEGSSQRCRAPGEVVDDIARLTDRDGIESIFFVDSVFNDDGETYLDVLREMECRGMSVPWTAFFRPAVISDEGMDLMKQTGLGSVEIGADACTDATLRRLGKPFTFDDVIRSNERFNQCGIATCHYFMFGGPGETEQTVREGVQNLIGLENTVSVVFMGIRVYPGSGLEKIALEDGVITPETNLLEPTYYISPQVERNRLEATLTEAFAGVKNCVFPPDALDDKLRILHRLGYKGAMWEMLLPRKRDHA